MVSNRWRSSVVAADATELGAAVFVGLIGAWWMEGCFAFLLQTNDGAAALGDQTECPQERRPDDAVHSARHRFRHNSGIRLDDPETEGGATPGRGNI